MRWRVDWFLWAGLMLSGAAAGEDEFRQFRESYGFLRTVAGNGEEDGGNDWRASMEGAPATTVDLSRPHMTVADATGNLYIADKEANAIRKVTVDGRIHTLAGTGEKGFSGDGPGTECQLNYPNGLFAQPDGTLYILDFENDRIRKLDREGRLTTLVHDREGIAIGRGLWVSADERRIVYSSGTRLREWTPDTGITTLAEGFVSLGNLDVDSRGQVYATDRLGHRVYRIDADGNKVRVAGNGRTSGGGPGRPALETGLEEVRGIALLENGAFLLATHRGGDIWYVDSEGIAHVLIEGDGKGNLRKGEGRPLSQPGKKISEPRAVVVGPNKNLIITTNDEGLVRVVKYQGKDS